MNIETIKENIEYLAGEEMTEDGIHHDDWPDHEAEYVNDIIKQLVEHYDYEQD